MPQTEGPSGPSAGRRVRPLARKTLAAQSDDRLVKLLREGHEPAFDEIVGRYQASLTAFAAAFIPYHRAEDVVQASLLKAHKALLADDRTVALRAWLFTIVRNGSLNAIRDEPQWQELDPAYDGVPQPAAVAEQNEELHALVLAICSLPDSQRRALVGRELEGEGHAELAAELGTTATAVRGLIFRARTNLRDALGAMVPLPVLRMLLSESAASAGAGAGAGVGIGLGAGGVGGGAKLAVVLSAAALVVGGGVAIDHHNRDGGSNEAAAAELPRTTPGSGSAAKPDGSGRALTARGVGALAGSGPAGGDAPQAQSRSGDGNSGGDSAAAPPARVQVGRAEAAQHRRRADDGRANSDERFLRLRLDLSEPFGRRRRIRAGER